MRIGLFGGTFDPPHVGHLILASEAFSQMDLDSLFWVLTPDPPHKKGQVITDVGLRKAMVKAEIKDFPEFTFSEIEIKRPGPHFAVDTVREFKLSRPDAQIFYLLGGDSLNDLPTWHDPTGFIRECHLIVVMLRVNEKPDWKMLDQKLPELHQKTVFLKTPIIEISSSDLRDRVKNGQPWLPFVTAGVGRIIQESNLYK
jgi:nicotinate-nucleotide adenylyltransferase